jgi:hypothetical protein
MPDIVGNKGLLLDKVVVYGDITIPPPQPTVSGMLKPPVYFLEPSSLKKVPRYNEAPKG